MKNVSVKDYLGTNISKGFTAVDDVEKSDYNRVRNNRLEHVHDSRVKHEVQPDKATNEKSRHTAVRELMLQELYKKSAVEKLVDNVMEALENNKIMVSIEDLFLNGMDSDLVTKIKESFKGKQK